MCARIYMKLRANIPLCRLIEAAHPTGTQIHIYAKAGACLRNRGHSTPNPLALVSIDTIKSQNLVFSQLAHIFHLWAFAPLAH